MDGKKPFVSFSRKRKHCNHDTKPQATATAHPQNIPAEIIIHPNVLMPEENEMVYGAMINAICKGKGISVTVPMSIALDENSSSNNGQVNGWPLLKNVQEMPCNNQWIINYNDNMAAASVDHGGNGGTSQENENPSEDNINDLLLKLEDIIANRELTEWEDAVEAFRRAIALMLKKVRDIRRKLKTYKAVDESK